MLLNNKKDKELRNFLNDNTSGNYRYALWKVYLFPDSLYDPRLYL
jgi:hypothetical protein